MQLKKMCAKRDFDFVFNNGKKIVSQTMVVFVYHTAIASDCLNVGIIASKKVGNAVARNRARRRIKGALLYAQNDCACNISKLVIIARKGCITSKFTELTQTLTRAFKGYKNFVELNK